MERRWKVLVVTAVAVFMGFLDVTIVNVAFPDIERDFADASRADLSWVLNAYNIVFAALLVPAGRLADLVGRRRMFLIGSWRFLPRLGAVRAGALAGALVGGAGAAGGGRRDPRAHLARAAAAGVPARAARHGGRDLERDRRRGRRARALAGRRARRRAGLALGLLRERADRPGGAGARPAAAARDARPGRRPARRARQRPCSWPAWARWRSASSRGRLGLGQRARGGARSPPRPCCCRPWCCAPRGTARR